MMIIMQRDGSGVVELVIFVLFIVIALGARLFEWIRKIQERENGPGHRQTGGRAGGLEDLLKSLRGESEEEEQEDASSAAANLEHEPDVWTVESELVEEHGPAKQVMPSFRTASFEAFAEQVREKERLAREAVAAAERSRAEAEALPVLMEVEIEPETVSPATPSPQGLHAGDLRGGVRWAVILGSPRGLQAWGEDGGLRPVGL